MVSDFEFTFVRFMKKCLNLPRGTSTASLLPLFNFGSFEARVFVAKLKFIRRAMRYRSHSPFIDSLFVSRTTLQRFGYGWFSGFDRELERYHLDETEVDLFVSGNEIFILIHSYGHARIMNRIAILPSARFFNTVFDFEYVYPDIVHSLASYSFEIMRLLIMFLAGNITWSIFRTSHMHCDRCGGYTSALNLITCPVMQNWFAFCDVNLDCLISLARNGQWSAFFDSIVEVLNLWCLESNNISPNVIIHLQDYMSNKNQLQ
jgi:hypothetical protein